MQKRRKELLRGWFVLFLYGIVDYIAEYLVDGDVELHERFGRAVIFFQLAKENRKFIYGLIREGARAKDFETAIMWLADCGLVHQVYRVTLPGLPLKAYADMKAFKLFLLDVGLLSCMTGLRQKTLLEGGEVFKEFKGALTEQYVMQELAAKKGIGVYYYCHLSLWAVFYLFYR